MTQEVKLLEPVPVGEWVLREHPCGRCGCVLRTGGHHPAVHTCHDQQSFFKAKRELKAGRIGPWEREG